MPEYIYDDHPEWEGMSPQQLPDWYNKGYASQEDYLLKTTGSPTPTVTAIPNNQLEGLSSQQILPPQQALLTPEQQSIVQNTDQQIAFQNEPTPVQQPVNVTIGQDTSPSQYFFTPPKQSTQPAQTTPQGTLLPGMEDTPAQFAGMTWDQRMDYVRQHPDVANFEYNRALSNAKVLQEAGQDASAQTKYAEAIKSLNGGQILTTQPETIDTSFFPMIDDAEKIVTDTTDEYRGKVDEETLTDIDTIGSSYTDAITTFESIIAEYEQSITGLLGQISSVINKPFDISTSPQYQALQEWAKITGDIGSRQALEELNERGILNSTVAADRVAQIRAQVQAQVLPQMIEAAYNMRQGEIDNMLQLYQVYSNQLNTYVSMEAEAFSQYLQAQKLELDRIEKEIDRAWERSESMGYVNNDDAIILGVTPGPTFAAKKFYEQEKSKIELAKTNNAAALERIKVTAAESMKRTKAAAEAAMARTKASNAASMARTEASNAAALERTQISTQAAAERAATSQASLRPKAVTLAQQDDRWLGATTIQQKQSLVDEYMELVGGEPGTDDVQQQIDDAVALGASNEEIRQALIDDGLDPSDFGY